MRVAIAGAGNVGLFIARDLAPAGHEVQIIEQNEEILRLLALRVAGTCTEPVLKKPKSN